MQAVFGVLEKDSHTMNIGSTYKTIAFQGMKGANSDMACRTALPGVETLPCVSFDDAFQAVQDGSADLAMIPVENTLGGRVADVHYLLPDSGLHIIGEYFQPIRHMLMASKGTSLSDIRDVHSHVQALAQCRKRLRAMGMTPHIHADTAGAAADLAAGKLPESAGALASTLAAELYGLEILQPDMQDANTNTTRFLIMARQPQTPPLDADKTYLTSLLFRVRNIPASLYKAMGGFATNGINMVKLESYVDENFNAALFYCDVESHRDSRALQLALEELDFYAAEIKILGTYEAAAFRKTLGN